ncbi:MAG TPA: flagellar biosynthesis protein FlgL [Aliiroseovarius sp.]|nr:flagellar biosynthesis protein FlgL [Aliiroseovarius sp.]
MSVLSYGDLASTFLTRRQSSGLKADLTRLGTEMSTGKKQDLGRALGGDFGRFAGIERSLKAVAAYKTANSEASSMLSAAQLALGNVQDMGQELSPALLTAANAADVTLIGATSEDARQKFGAVVSTLNVQPAGRSLFGCAATDRPALASGDEIMAELMTTTAAETTAAGILAAVDAWFDTPGGGFENLGYLGSVNDMGPLVIADDETAELSVRADDAAIRDTLKGFALAGMVAEGAPAGNVQEQAALMEAAAENMLTSDGGVTNLRARLGAVEARVDGAQARNSAEAAAYELARTELIGADPYEAASALEAVYSQIETLYTVTAHIAGLTFTDYMK